MRVTQWCLMLALTWLGAGALTGCGKKGDDGQAQQNPQGGQQQNPGGQQQQPDPRGVGIPGAGDRATVMNDMKNFGTYLTQYVLGNNGKGPPNAKAFTDFMGRDGAAFAKKLEQNQYGLLVVPRPNASTVVIYEVAGDTAGNHYVVMGDGSQTTMQRADLQKLKAKN
jgi:hypothetical protein